MKISAILFMFTLLLAGCVQLPEPQNIPWHIHQQQLNNLSKWSFTGKLAIITPEERHSVNIYWTQSENDFHITLTTFLGGTVLDVKKTQLGTKIINNDGEQFFATDTEVLIKQLSGLVIPIDALQQWIKGNPQNATFQLNKNDQVASLKGVDIKNRDWSVTYDQYKNTQAVSLPSKLQLNRLDLRLKFAISQWQIK